MKTIVVEGRVGDDGSLQILLPLGLAEAGKDVRVTIEPVDSNRVISPDEWRAGILESAGGWQGDFDLPAEGEMEERVPLVSTQREIGLKISCPGS